MRIGLTLSGGGARGFAHAGVLRALDERGYTVEAISGTSMGGVMGALYASGHIYKDIHRMAADLSPLDLLRVGKHGALMGGDGIENVLARYVPATFEDLTIPLQVTAVDLQKGRLVLLNSGPLVPALRATSAIPGVLEAVNHEGRWFGDGGLLNDLPVDVVRAMTRAPVVAINVAPPPDRELRFEDDRGLMEKIKDRLNWKQRESLTLELFLKDFYIAQALITEMRLAVNPPDLYIQPPLPTDFKIEHFGRYEEAMKIGYEAAEAALAGWTPD